MKDIGIVICNYNKCEYVLQCIDSVLNSTYQGFEIFVVDNASVDDSVKKIRKKFGLKVHIIVNEENLGGSGGFNTGIRKVLEQGYKYIMCVDNDIIMAPDNIEMLYGFLEEYSDVGIVGSKICRMDEKNRLQELGADIDFDMCNIKPHFKNCLDNEELPEVQYCDYVPACSLMIRTEVVYKIGLMPEENFIYWDDMEWGYLAKLAGYRVAAYRDAKVYHAMGTNSGNTYFSTYYFWRNRIAFFIKYATTDNAERVYAKLSEELFQILYGSYYKGKNNQIKVITASFADAVQGRMGKAESDRILSKDIIEDRVKNLFINYKNIIINFNGDFKFLQTLLNKVSISSNVVIFAENKQNVLAQQPDYRVIDKIESDAKSAIHLVMCEHVTKIKSLERNKIFVDKYSNVIENESDIRYFMNYTYSKDLFEKCFISLFKLLNGN